MKAIVFSDIHLHAWTKYNTKGERLRNQLKVLEFLFKLAFKEKVPLLFTGDLFHSPVGISNSLFSAVIPFILELFRMYPGVEIYAISGNHDFEGVNTWERRSPSYVHSLSNSIRDFYNIDFETIELKELVLHGIPYLTHNVGFQEAVDRIKIVEGKCNILMNHGDYHGQKDTNGITIGKGENVNEESLQKFDLVLSGHIHKGGFLRQNIYSVGAPMQHRLSDLGGSFGYWIIRNNFKPLFKEIDWTPKFRMYTSDSDKDNSTDFWVKEPKADEEIREILEDEMDYQNITKLGTQYLTSIGVTSRRKRLLLHEILTETENREWQK